MQRFWITVEKEDFLKKDRKPITYL